MNTSGNYEQDKLTPCDGKSNMRMQEAPPKNIKEIEDTVNKPQKMKDGKLLQLFWQNRHETVTYCLVFWAFGMCVALLGPTLLDLGCKTSNVFSAMSWAFFSQSLCTLVGSATGGLLVQRYGAHPVLLIACSMLAFTLSVIALCNQLFLLTIVLGVMGFFMGTIDTVANLSMISLYGKHVAPFLQALHFFYGFGAFLSPLISMPFLLSDDCGDQSPSSSLGKMQIPISAVSKSDSNSTEEVDTYALVTSATPVSHIQYAFWIMALLQVPVILLVASLIAKDLKQDYNNSDTILKPSSFPANALLSPTDAETSERPPVTSLQTSSITGLTAVLLFLSDGLQASFGGYVYSYAVKSVAYLSIPKAAYLNACFWGTFAFGRLVSIWLATRMTPIFMLFCNITGCIFAILLMICTPHSHVALYLGTCIFGTFLSSVYPTAISLADTYIKLTSPITTVMVVSAAAGEMSMPVIVGHEFDLFGPMSFLVTEFIVTLLSIVVFIALYVTGSSILRPTASRGVFGALTDCLPYGKQETQEDSLLMQHQVKYYSRMRSDLSETSLEQTSQGCYTDKSQETSYNYQMTSGM